MSSTSRFILQSALALALVACTGDEDADSPTGLDAGPLPDAGLSSFDANSTAADAQSGGGAIDAARQPDATQPVADTGIVTDAALSDAALTDAASNLPKFSFFVTSLAAMRQVSGNRNGFGGNFTHGETGEGAGLRGADKICAEVAEIGMPGASAKQWRAFLSTTTVNARTRIGNGPWYDRMGRLVAQNLTDLLQERPRGIDSAIRDDLPNELGVPNQAGSAENGLDDNHDTVTATNASGDYDGSNTCADWTSTTATVSGGAGGGRGGNGPRVGHSWPAMSGRNWMAAHNAPGCAPSVALMQTGGGSGNGIGNGGGYGGIYCFALTP